MLTFLFVLLAHPYLLAIKREQGQLIATPPENTVSVKLATTL